METNGNSRTGTAWEDRSPWIKFLIEMVHVTFRAGFVFVENLFGFLFYVFVMIAASPIALFSSKLYWKIDEYLVWRSLTHMGWWLYVGSAKMVEYGDRLTEYEDKNCLLVANHQSDADPFLILSTLRRCPTLHAKILVILEDIFYWTFFGIMMRIRGDFFVHQGRHQRHMQSILLREHLQSYCKRRNHGWCILFPEGGFFFKRKSLNREFALKNDYPLLEYCTLPRLGAIRAIISAKGTADNPVDQTSETEKPLFPYLIDMTIGYPRRKPFTLLEMLFDRNIKPHVHVHYRISRIPESVADDENVLRNYMYDLWKEKDSLLQHFYEHGRFPGASRVDTFELDLNKLMKHWVIVVLVDVLVYVCPFLAIAMYFLGYWSW